MLGICITYSINETEATIRKTAILGLFALLPLSALAGREEAENALTSILFEENMENVSYSLRSNGFVEILFGVSVSATDYARVVERLRKHPDIPGVLAGKGGRDYCPTTR